MDKKSTNPSKEESGYGKKSFNPNKYNMIKQGIKLINLIPSILKVQGSHQIKGEFSTLLKHPLGLPLLLHLDKYHAFTYLELENLFNQDKDYIRYLVEAFQALNLVEEVTKVKRYGRSVGNAPKVWLEVGADPMYSAEAIKRHQPFRKKPRLGISQKQLPEATALAKAYMDHRVLKTIPDRVILEPLLKEKGIRVNYDRLVEALVKEGYTYA